MLADLPAHLSHLAKMMPGSSLGLLQGLLRLFVFRWYYPGPLLIFLFAGLLFYPLFPEKKAAGAGGSLKERLKFLFPSKLYRHRSSRVDYFAYVVNTLVGPVVAFTSFVAIEGMVRLALQRHFGQPAMIVEPGWIATALEFAVIFLMLDFGDFFRHYLFHKIPFLWRLHRAHHSAEILTPFSGPRTHPLDFVTVITFPNIFAGLTGGVFLYLIGAPLKLSPVALSLVAATNVYVLVQAPFRHSHLWISYGRWERIFYSPAMHTVHHSTLLKHRDKNIGQILSVWDWMFGTLYIPNGRESFPLGIDDAELGENHPHKTAKDFYIEPIVTMFETIFRSILGGTRGRLTERVEDAPRT
jgi:sterol desaturase/sphingolipid hydroxylase (fatty acid hydroxylase superfamily)